MQRSSESVAALATALAKAQVELVNPEKSQVAMIRADRPGDTAQSFRYAPLSSGLDIVRKTLGRYEIATIQTTTIDQPAGIVHLTTMLAHTSGEWIASDWPVCKVADMTSPKWMGAALTYARRYALFTLVGIAGEDDLDAPDLGSGRGPDPSHRIQPDDRSLNGDPLPTGVAPRGSTHGRKPIPRSRNPILAPEESAGLRDRLLAELAGLETADDAALWAHRLLPAKNTLTAADANAVENAFRTKVSAFDDATAVDDSPAIAQSPSVSQAGHPGSDRVGERRAPSTRGNGRTRLRGKTIRLRDKEHRKFVARQPCVVCGRSPSDPHHLRFAQPRALGRKVSDEFTIPVCRLHHRALHRHGDEAAWWRMVAIDPIPIALKLWRHGRTIELDKSHRPAGTNLSPDIDAESPGSDDVGGPTPQ